MGWVRLDDAIAMHPKLVPLSDSAFRLFIASICYANRLLTDGEIQSKMVSALAPNLAEPDRAAAELNAAGLWHKARNGNWQIHDYADYQPSSELVRARLIRDRARKSARIPRGIQMESARNPNGIPADSERSRGRKPNPTRTKTPPTPPRGGRQRDQTVFREQLRDYAIRRYPSAPTPTQAIHGVKQAVTYGKATTDEQVDAWVREHFPELGDPRP